MVSSNNKTSESGFDNPVRNKMPAKRLLLISFTLILGIIVCLEVVVRYKFGMGTPLLYQADAGCGYRVSPNQDLHRIGSHIVVNAQGLRNDAIEAAPAPQHSRILCVGDSVTFGGTQTDQTKTVSALLSGKLAAKNPVATEVLNASAGGWALGNEEGFIKTYGVFNSDTVVLILNTGDLFQPLVDGTTIVDVHPSFPSHRPVSALQEILTRYVIPRVFHKSTKDPGVEFNIKGKDLLRENLQRVENIDNFVSHHGAKLFVVLHEPQDEIRSMPPQVKDGEDQLTLLLKKHQVPLLLLTPYYKHYDIPSLYRDNIHPNPKGNDVMADAIASWLIDKKWNQAKVAMTGKSHRDRRVLAI